MEPLWLLDDPKANTCLIPSELGREGLRVQLYSVRVDNGD